MSTKDENPWLLIDGLDDEIIVGNRVGFISLRDKIDRILENSGEDPTISFEGTNINRIVLDTKEKYLEVQSTYKETFGQKIAASLLAIWFLVLPFVAIALTVSLLFFSAEDSNCNMPPIPMQSCVKNVFPLTPYNR